MVEDETPVDPTEIAPEWTRSSTYNRIAAAAAMLPDLDEGEDEYGVRREVDSAAKALAAARERIEKSGG
jgi:hypothetical protein